MGPEPLPRTTSSPPGILRAVLRARYSAHPVTGDIGTLLIKRMPVFAFRQVLKSNPCQQKHHFMYTKVTKMC